MAIVLTDKLMVRFETVHGTDIKLPEDLCSLHPVKETRARGSNSKGNITFMRAECCIDDYGVKPSVYSVLSPLVDYMGSNNVGTMVHIGTTSVSASTKANRALLLIFIL
jgi:hypothetical protein